MAPRRFDYYPKPYANARDFVEENLAMQEQGNYLPYAIVLLTSGEAIGCTVFYPLTLMALGLVLHSRKSA